MRVIRWSDLGCTSGRLSCSTNSFQPGFVLDEPRGGEEESTLLPSERIKATQPLSVAPVEPRTTRLLGNSKAFTLVEVLTVVAILTVLAVFLVAVLMAPKNIPNPNEIFVGGSFSSGPYSPIMVTKHQVDGKEYLVTNRGGIVFHREIPTEQGVK